MKRKANPHRTLTVFCLWVGFVLCPLPGRGQIGGQTSAEGPFLLDDVEVLNLMAEGVERLWIPDYIYELESPLEAVELAGSGLTLASGQSPVGALRFRVPSSFGYINKGFGVPMPGVKGASSLDHPGDVTSYTHLSFFLRYAPVLTNQKFLIILETYPGPNHPKLYWGYTVASGTTFQEVHVDLRTPASVENADGLGIEDLLGQTRFLSFHFYGETGFVPRTLEVHIDDIRLTGVGSSPSPTPTATPTATPSPTPLPVRQGSSWYFH